MKVHYMCCARSSAIDASTRQLSLFHVLDEISTSCFPLHLSDFSVACLFEREPHDEPTQNYVMAISLDGALLASFMMRLDFANGRRHRNVNNVQGLTIPAAGSIQVAIMQKTTILATWHLAVIQARAHVAPPSLLPKANQNEVQQVVAKPGPTIN